MENKLLTLLTGLYGASQADGLARRIEQRLTAVVHPPAVRHRSSRWSAADVLLITYADSFSDNGHESPLTTLRGFLRDWVQDAVSIVHLLPFFPFTSDDGFAVSDYRVVDPANGDWNDIAALSADYALAFDYVVNHASSAHAYFRQFLNDEAPGRTYFMTAPGDADVQGVTRPRAHPLLQEYKTAGGSRWVWCTFSRDQVDWDFSNPEVMYEFVELLIDYYEKGASWLRVDAVAFLWKKIGTTCIHLEETHTAVKLFRCVAELLSPGYKLLTETNVPLAENLSYFGDGDEAHIVYNFSLPPLLLHALLTERADYLTAWCQSLPALPEGCTYLNFSASHDGIGLRPAEGILPDEELSVLVECVHSFGGRIGYRQRVDGSLSPYEANISLFDALQGTAKGTDAWQTSRFFLSQCLMSAMAGVPALYYNSLVAAPNNLAGMAETGRNRTINRKKWSRTEIDKRLEDPDKPARIVLDEIKRMLAVRKAHDAFHPLVKQVCLTVDPRVFVLNRIISELTVTCVFNLSSETVRVPAASLGLESPETATKIYQFGVVERLAEVLSLAPYSIIWLEATSA